MSCWVDIALCLVAKQVPVPLLLDGYCCLYRVQWLPTLHTVWGLLPAQFKVNPPPFVALIPCFLLVKPVFSFVHFNILLVELNPCSHGQISWFFGVKFQHCLWCFNVKTCRQCSADCLNLLIASHLWLSPDLATWLPSSRWSFSHLACAVGFDSHSAHSAGVLSMGLDALGISACVWLGFWPSFFLVFFLCFAFWLSPPRTDCSTAGHVFFSLGLAFCHLLATLAWCIGRWLPHAVWSCPRSATWSMLVANSNWCWSNPRFRGLSPHFCGRPRSDPSRRVVETRRMPWFEEEQEWTMQAIRLGILQNGPHISAWWRTSPVAREGEMCWNSLFLFWETESVTH